MVTNLALGPRTGVVFHAAIRSNCSPRQVTGNKSVAAAYANFSLGPAAVLFLVAWHVATYLSVQVAELVPAFAEMMGMPKLKAFIKREFKSSRYPEHLSVCPKKKISA